MKLPSVTLLCIDDVNVEGAIKVLERCKKMIEFGDVKLLTSKDTDYEHAEYIMPLNSLVSYSIFMLTECHSYINTEHVLIVQRDGFILNPNSWKDSWLQYDYIAPLFVQFDLVGSGGFSMRSKKLMEHAAKVTPHWDGTQEHANQIQSTLGYYEDGVITLSEKFKHFRIATLQDGCEFGQGGNRNANYFREYPFGFHRTWQTIDFKTGRVDSTDTSKTLNASYDHEL
jgi:hypothetical protein